MWSLRVLGLGMLGLGVLGLGVGCADTLPRSLDGDLTRRVAPIPACVMRLPVSGKTGSPVAQLREEQFWKLVFPAFDEAKQQLPEGALDCAGRGVYDSPALTGGRPLRGWPFQVKEGDIVFGAGGSRLRLVWLRTHAFPDGSAGGALSLVRTVDGKAEVYGVGAYRGPAEQSKLRIERMGPEVVPTVQAEGCLNPEEQTPCETTLLVYLPRKGQLHPVAEVVLSRVGIARDAEPGVEGTIVYRLTSSPKFEPGRLSVLEQVVVEDGMGRALRKAELERVYTLTDGKLVESEPSLWARFFDVTASKDGAGE